VAFSGEVRPRMRGKSWGEIERSSSRTCRWSRWGLGWPVARRPRRAEGGGDGKPAALMAGGIECASPSTCPALVACSGVRGGSHGRAGVQQAAAGGAQR